MALTTPLVYRCGLGEASSLLNLAGRGSIPRFGQVAWIRFFRGFPLSPMDESQVTLSGVWNTTISRHFLSSLIIPSSSSVVVHLVFRSRLLKPSEGTDSLDQPARICQAVVIGNRQRNPLPSSEEGVYPSGR